MLQLYDCVVKMTKTLYGDGFLTLGLKYVDCGNPEDLHDIFDYAVAHGAKPLKIPHPLNVFQRVLNALDKDERFEKCQIRYDGIYKKPVRLFRLKTQGD